MESFCLAPHAAFAGSLTDYTAAFTLVSEISNMARRNARSDLLAEEDP